MHLYFDEQVHWQKKISFGDLVPTIRGQNDDC